MPYLYPQKKIPVNATLPDLQSRYQLCDTRGIVLRGTFYQLRVRVPTPVANHIGRREIRLSLHTASRREALRRGLPLLDRLERIFDDIRRQLVTEETVRDITQKFRHNLLTAIPPGQSATMLMTMPATDVDIATRRYRQLIDLDKEALRYGRFEHIEETLHRFATAAGITVERDSDNYPLLLQQALLARIMAFEVKEQHALGNYDVLGTPQPVPPAAPAAAAQNSLSISELCDKYVHDKFQTEGAWEEHGTLNAVLHSLNNFRTIIGGEDTPVSSFSRETFNNYKTTLAGLPNQKLPRYSGKHIRELLEMEIPKKDRIAKGTVNNQLIWVVALMEWASLNDHVAKNYAKGLIIKRSIVDKNRKEDCAPYSDADIRLICEHLTFDPNRMERFWGPLIAFHTGARRNEVGQLLVQDIVTKLGVLCFKITNEEEGEAQQGQTKKIKTQAGKRVVPVHQLLLDLGFEEYVNEMRNAREKQLFPALKPAKRGYGVYLGNWYGREISNKLFPGRARRKVFNSSRHSVEDKYKHMAEMRDSAQSYLTGHATGKEDFDRYGSDPMAPFLKQYVDRIDYGIDIEFLKVKMANPVFTFRGKKKKCADDALVIA